MALILGPDIPKKSWLEIIHDHPNYVVRIEGIYQSYISSYSYSCVGLPLVIIQFHRIFRDKPTILGVSPFLENPIWVGSSISIAPQLAMAYSEDALPRRSGWHFCRYPPGTGWFSKTKYSVMLPIGSMHGVHANMTGVY